MAIKEILKMRKLLWLLLLPSLAFAVDHTMSRPDPVFVKVEHDHIVIYPEKTIIAAAGIDAPDSEFEQFLKRFEAQRDTRYIVLILRPGSAVFQRQLRKQIRAHGIDVGFEAIDALQTLSPEGTPQTQSHVLASAPAPTQSPLRSLADLVEASSKTPEPSPSPVYLECRNNQLFPISVENLDKAIRTKLDEFKNKSHGDQTEYLRLVAQTTLEVDGQRLDLASALMGEYILLPIPDASGNPLADPLDAVNPEKHILHLYVRPDSTDLSSEVRALAQERNIAVHVHPLKEKEFIRIGRPNPRTGYEL